MPDPTKTSDQNEPAPGGLRRFWPLVAIALGLGVFFAFDLGHYLKFETLRDNRGWLMDQVHAHAILSALVFMGIYAAATAISAPGGSFLTICAGFLFGQWVATIYVVFAATVGATIIFAAARYMFYDALRTRAGPWLTKMEAGFQKNALSYLLALRLAPVFPFFVVNLAPAFLNVPLKTYVIGTFIGIIPGTFVFATIGAGLGGVFDSDEAFSLSNLLTTEIVFGLAGLAALALAPAVFRALKSKK
jgi:uncharacterized membrane protein YdjX (TVP38/TMEM64 family)